VFLYLEFKILKDSLKINLNKQIINKGKIPAREQEKRKERIQVQTKEHTQKCRTHNGEL
jgi:hypothetical protein